MGQSEEEVGEVQGKRHVSGECEGQGKSGTHEGEGDSVAG